MTATASPTSAGVTISDWSEAATYRAALLEVINAQRVRVPSGSLGPCHGPHWCGSKDLFLDARAKPLEDWLRSLFPTPVEGIDAWGFVMESGSSVDRHDHVRSHRGGRNAYAGVYYVTGPEDSGQLLAWPGEPQSIAYAPKMGRALTFPATLPHAVAMHMSHVPRISIAFSAKALD